MRKRFARLPVVVIASALVAPIALVGAAPAQTTTTTNKPGKHKNNDYGSPLHTLMSTHLWTDVSPAQDFVRESRPKAKDLDYTPLVGTDPQRPKPRDKANIEALRAELERDAVVNDAKGRGLRPPAKAAAKPRRTKPAG